MTLHIQKQFYSHQGIPDALKSKCDNEQSPISTEIIKLREVFISKDEDSDNKDKFARMSSKDDDHIPLFIRDSNQNVTFLNSSVSVPKEDASDTDLDTYCKETVFSGFWKTLKKLCNGAYRMFKSGLDILKKLFKKVVDFLEAGMKTVVISIGHAIARIVAWVYPIPEYKKHE